MYSCKQCGAEFDTEMQLVGHTGGAHTRKLTPIKHGTEWGYQQHLKRNVKPCNRCKKAKREAMAAWRAGEKTPTA